MKGRELGVDVLPDAMLASIRRVLIEIEFAAVVVGVFSFPLFLFQELGMGLLTEFFLTRSLVFPVLHA